MTKKNVATPGETAKRSLKFKLTHRQVTELSVDRWPTLSATGRVVMTARPAHEAGKPYRVLDGNQEAPTGFGFWVGKTKTSYEVVKRGPDGVRRFSLGNVTDMGLEEAYEEARSKLRIVKETGSSPAQFEAATRDRAVFERITVEECFLLYIADLEEAVAKKLKKAASVTALKDSLARLKRPEVGIAQREVRGLNETIIKAAFGALRKSAMVRSNRIPTAMKQALAPFDNWAALSTEQLEHLGITGRYIQRVRSAGLAATEHSFSDARRAVTIAVRREKRRARAEGREPALRHNPFDVILEDKLMRDAAALRLHYDRAQVRNPLGDDTLPKVLKAILARRDEQQGLNATAADYLLLTLLWGTRRSEAVQLRWFDRCAKGQLHQEEVSWVWLAEPDEVNPFTRRSGSQAFLSDTKSGERRFLPVTYFAERILRRRFNERVDDTEAKEAAAAAAELLKHAEAKKASARSIAALKQEHEDARHALERTRFVFPARSKRSQAGHYSDSKSILANVRRDAGLADIREEVDQGLTPHDLRRTLGRYAALLFGQSRIVSQMLDHHVPAAGSDMAAVSQRYTEQEWSQLRAAFGEVEEAMIGRSPRVWNRLKGTDKPRLDEQHDPPVTIFLARQQTQALDDDDFPSTD